MYESNIIQLALHDQNNSTITYALYPNKTQGITINLFAIMCFFAYFKNISYNQDKDFTLQVYL